MPHLYHQVFLRARILWCCFCLLSIQAESPLLAQMVLGEEEPTSKQVLSTVPFVGFRKTSDEFFDANTSAQRQGIPANLFISSAQKTKAVMQTLDESGTSASKATLDDLWTASLTTKQKLAMWPRPKDDKVGWSKDYQGYDPTLFVGLAGTEVFPSKKPATYMAAINGGGETEWIAADQSAFKTWAKAYRNLYPAWTLPATESQKRFVQVNDTFASLPKLKSVLRFETGHVTFGQPQVSTPKIQGIEVNARLPKGDLRYAVILAVTFRDLGDIAIRDIAELTFAAVVLEKALAVALLPLRFDKIVEQEQTLAVPEIKLQYGPAAVSVGKIAEEHIVFKSLKPTVVASGLQESNFSWSMRDDAIHLGSHRFVAVLQVPKGTSSLILQLSARAITSSKYIFWQGQTIATEPQLARVQLSPR